MEADIQIYLKQLYEFEKALFEEIILKEKNNEDKKQYKYTKINESEEQYDYIEINGDEEQYNNVKINEDEEQYDYAEINEDEEQYNYIEINEDEEQYNYNEIKENKEIHKTEPNIKNIHDTSFRNVLANKMEAYLFINTVLKLKDTKNEINIEELEQCDNRYITRDYYNKETDILYKIKNRQVYFLIEHQSSVDYEMPKRIMEYIIEILRKNVEHEEVKNKRYKLPLIIPIVLYTGNKTWKVKEYLGEVQEKMPGYHNKEFGRYILVDTNKYKEEELIEKEGALSKILLLEKSKDVEKAYEKIKYKDLKEYEKELIYEYTCNVVAKVSPELKIEEIKEKLIKREGGKSMLADAFLKCKEYGLSEGRKEGRKEGIIEGKKTEKLKIAKSLKIMGLKVEDIVRATGLSKSEIEKL